MWLYKTQGSIIICGPDRYSSEEHTSAGIIIMITIIIIIIILLASFHISII